MVGSMSRWAGMRWYSWIGFVWLEASFAWGGIRGLAGIHPVIGRTVARIAVALLGGW